MSPPNGSYAAILSASAPDTSHRNTYACLRAVAAVDADALDLGGATATSPTVFVAVANAVRSVVVNALVSVAFAAFVEAVAAALVAVAVAGSAGKE